MIIFDFDGTIADTISLGLNIINDYADHFKYSKIIREQNDDLSALELIKKVGIKLWKFPYLVWFLKQRIGERTDEIKIFPGIQELMEKLKKSGFELGIITSNSQKNVSDFLQRNNIVSFFSYIKTGVPTFNKKSALIKAKKIFKTNFVYVGDELRDIEACRHAGIPLVSVAWGFNSAASLEKHNPGQVAKNSEEALDLILKTAQTI